MSSIIGANAYLILHGKAEQAIELYKTALGAELQMLQRFGDVDQGCPEASKQQIMHAELRLGSALIMLSDGAKLDASAASASARSSGASVSIALALTDPTETRRCFDALAASGTVIEPLFDAPWGALFGVLRDAFGVSWMFNCMKPAT